MNRLELEAKRQMLRRELRPLDEVTFTCMRCENFSPTTKICSVFSEVPPPDVIATDVDCKAWVFDGIPW